MRYLLLFIALIFLGCTPSKEKEQIHVFESTLGKEYVKVLNQLVYDFETNLEIQYPKLSQKEAYKQYLLDIRLPKVKDSKKYHFQSKKTNKLFHESGFWNDIYSYDLNNDSTLELTPNNLGKYMMSLHELKDKDSVVGQYYNIREAAGLLQNEIFVDGFLYHKPDFNNYIHKRIVVIEFSF